METKTKTTECITECPDCPEVDMDAKIEGWGDWTIGGALFVAFIIGMMFGS